MKNRNRDKQSYSNSFQSTARLDSHKTRQVFSYQFLIPIIIIIVLIFIGYKASKGQSTNYKFEADNTQVEVVGSTGQVPSNSSVQGGKTDSTGQQLGPATVQDLGGNSGSTNIDELLKDKQIEVGK